MVLQMTQEINPAGYKSLIQKELCQHGNEQREHGRFKQSRSLHTQIPDKDLGISMG